MAVRGEIRGNCKYDQRGCTYVYYGEPMRPVPFLKREAGDVASP